MSNGENEVVGSFGYGFRLVRRSDGQLEFQPTTLIRNVPIEFVIMQLQIYLDDLKKEYRDRYGRGKPSDGK